MREELENAVVSLDGKRIKVVVSQISEYDASLGNVLGRFAGAYTYTPILEALRSCKKRLTEARS
jgi:hypothetical protein